MSSMSSMTPRISDLWVYLSASPLLGLTLTLIMVLLVFQDFASLMRNHTHLRYLINPLSSFYSVGYLAFKQCVCKIGAGNMRIKMITTQISELVDVFCSNGSAFSN